MRLLPSVILSLLLAACGAPHAPKLAANPPRLEPVVLMAENPGNAAISEEGAVFATIHPFRAGDLKLVRVTGAQQHEPFPNAKWNSAKPHASERWVNPLGLRSDREGHLWVIDSGDAKRAIAPKLVAFDTKRGDLVYRYEFPRALAPKESFLQDLAIDAKRGVAYIADAGERPGIVTVDSLTNRATRVDGLQAFEAEDRDLVVDGKVVTMKGRPARIGLNPITLSQDGEWLYFGAMNGTRWYGVPTELLRNNASRDEIDRAIREIGPKPLSDGAATDAEGNHYFTDVERQAIARLDRNGRLATLLTDPLLDWPDSIDIGEDGALYIAVNQLHKAAALNGGREAGRPPYGIYRVVP